MDSPLTKSGKQIGYVLRRKLRVPTTCNGSDELLHECRVSVAELALPLYERTKSMRIRKRDDVPEIEPRGFMGSFCVAFRAKF